MNVTERYSSFPIFRRIGYRPMYADAIQLHKHTQPHSMWFIYLSSTLLSISTSFTFINQNKSTYQKAHELIDSIYLNCDSILQLGNALRNETLLSVESSNVSTSDSSHETTNMISHSTPSESFPPEYFAQRNSSFAFDQHWMYVHMNNTQNDTTSNTSITVPFNETVPMMSSDHNNPLTIMDVTIFLVKLTQIGIGPFSIVTNGLSLLIFARLFKTNRNVLGVLSILCIVDTLALIPQFSYVVSYITPNSLTSYNVGCKVLNWLPCVAQDCSSYFSLIYTGERCISVVWPMRVKLICTQKRILSAMLVAALVTASLESHHFVLYTTMVNSCSNFFVNFNLSQQLQFAIHMVVGTTIPYILIAALNAIIIIKLIRQREEQQNMIGNSSSQKKSQAQRTLTITLVSASVFSLMVSIPNIVYCFILAILPLEVFYTNDNLVLFSLWASKIILPWNYCGNFFFYILAGRTFRSEFVKMLLCRKSTSTG